MAGWSENHDLKHRTLGIMMMDIKWKWDGDSREPTLLRGILSFRDTRMLPAGESHAFLPLPRPATCFVAKETSGEGSARRNFGFL